MLYTASDHAGYKLKHSLIAFLNKNGIKVEDTGPFSLTPEDDYPDYIPAAMQGVQASSQNRAIIICRNGVGVSVLANKYKGIRCALSWNPDHAKTARNDDNANVLALPSDYISNKEAEEIVKVWLSTPFSNEERHKRRLKKVAEIESSLCLQ